MFLFPNFALITEVRRECVFLFQSSKFESIGESSVRRRRYGRISGSWCWCVGLRAIVKEDEVGEVLDILKDRTVELGAQTWNRRYRDYMEKIKTGSVHEVAAVLRDLFLLSVDKDLSYGERKMLDTAKGLLIKELSLAKNLDEENISSEIDMIFA